MGENVYFHTTTKYFFHINIWFDLNSLLGVFKTDYRQMKLHLATEKTVILLHKMEQQTTCILKLQQNTNSPPLVQFGNILFGLQYRLYSIDSQQFRSLLALDWNFVKRLKLRGNVDWNGLWYMFSTNFYKV